MTIKTNDNFTLYFNEYSQMSKPSWTNPKTPIININLQLEKVYGSPKRSKPVKIKRGGVDDLACLDDTPGTTG